MTEKKKDSYKKYYDSSKLRPLKEVEKLLDKEKDPALLKKLRYERRLIYYEMYWSDEIDFEEFAELIRKAKKPKY